MDTIKYVQKRSLIGKPESQRRIVRALGLRRIGHVVEQKDTPQIRGMINKVSHIVEIVD
ncbi:MAG: 50S ribosomal protein L30 [Ezakiella sp.]|nr:50S ribosomal protein L30 [Ezakiella sp.]MDD7472374.1 50S ribosomal protein L30 [Bacillota bacterium]MDY3923108.1 50S ribosomal protein L30 [Ezakiella sp.]